MTNVYLISSEINGQKLYKIGITKRDVEKRLKELKTGNAAEMSLVECFSSKWGSKIEAHLHRLHSAKRVSGEWFALEITDIEDFMSRCRQLHENLDIIESENTYFIDRGGRF